jgi:hypothetical protein
MIDPPPKRNPGSSEATGENQQTEKRAAFPQYSHPAPGASIGANGDHPREVAPDELERQHFELTRKLFELRSQLKRRQGLPSGQIGHIRAQAGELEAQIELLELALGAIKVEAIAVQRSEPPRSKNFLAAFYHAAKTQLPPELLRRLEQSAAATKKP